MPIYSEVTQLNKIANGILQEAMSDFVKAWKDDLVVIREYEEKADVIDVANAYLKYYGSHNRVVDVNYDYRYHCFLWDVEKITKENEK